MLKSFVGEKGVRWSSQKRNVQIAGRGTVTVEEKGLLDADEPVNQWHADLIRINKERSLARMVMNTPNTPKERSQAVETPTKGTFFYEAGHHKSLQ